MTLQPNPSVPALPRSNVVVAEWKITFLALVFLATFLRCADANAGTLTVGLGADYATGTYGEPNKTIDWYVPVSLAYKTGNWRAKLVVPYVSVEGNGEVLGSREDRTVDDRRGRNRGTGNSGGEDDDDDDAEDAATIAAGGSVTTRHSGLGDTSFSLTYSAIADDASGWFVDLTLRTKFGTASEADGLGTGKHDYGVSLDLDKDIGRATLSLSLGYTVVGEPEGFDYRNVVSGSTGLSYRFTDAVSANTYVSYRQSVRAGAPAQLDVSPGLSFRLSSGHRVNTYVLFGLDDGSPDFGAGLAYSLAF